MENEGLWPLAKAVFIFGLVVYHVACIRRLRRENASLRRELETKRRERDPDDFWKRYRDTAPKL